VSATDLAVEAEQVAEDRWDQTTAVDLPRGRVEPTPPPGYGWVDAGAFLDRATAAEEEEYLRNLAASVSRNYGTTVEGLMQPGEARGGGKQKPSRKAAAKRRGEET
jgi:hypothetical protein